jgi:hypothetical protein
MLIEKLCPVEDDGSIGKPDHDAVVKTVRFQHADGVGADCHVRSPQGLMGRYKRSSQMWLRSNSARCDSFIAKATVRKQHVQRESNVPSSFTCGGTSPWRASGRPQRDLRERLSLKDADRQGAYRPLLFVSYTRHKRPTKVMASLCWPRPPCGQS